jgi:signal transduction histidine kinase/ligand-binding sensor domain-containing protein
VKRRRSYQETLVALGVVASHGAENPSSGRRRFVVCSLVILMAVVSPAAAQYHFDSWTAEHGLPHNWLKGIWQTRDGYIWVTTGGGVVRFDGARFKVFNQSNTPELTSNRFTFSALWEDSEGALWMGTINGGVIRYLNGVFTAITTAQGLPNNRVLRIDEDEDGNVWIFTESGLAKWKNGVLTRVAPAPDSPFNDHLVAPKNLGVDGEYFGLWRMNATGWERFAYGRWSPLPLPPHLTNPAALQVGSIIEDAHRRLWYKVVGDDYYRLSDGQANVLRGIPAMTRINYEDSQGRLWLGDEDGRNALLKDGQLTPLAGLSTPYVLRAFEDREGTLWVATYDQGLYRLREHLVTVHQHGGGAQANAISVLLQDRAGTVWTGAGGLARIVDGRFENVYREGRSRLPWSWENVVTALFEDVDGTLWVATYDGIVRFRNQRLHEEPRISAQITGRVRAIRRDRAGDLWFGGDQGLYRLRNGVVTRYSASDGLAADDVKVIHEDRSGTLWIGTGAGLSRLTDGVFSSLTRATGLSANRISALYEDTAGILWVGTYDGGLNRLQPTAAGPQITRYTTEQGLYDNGVFQILEDDHGAFWIGGQRGIYRVRKQELEDVAGGRASSVVSMRLGKEDGLVSVEIAGGEGDPIGFKAQDGRLWFPTTAGVAVVDPKRISFNRLPPPVVIEECVVDRREATSCQDLMLNPSQENLEIHYTGLSFIKSDQMRFRYKMDGLDRDWVDAGARRTAYYSHLPSGNYVFRVTAANADGVWNDAGEQVTILVLPPFYRTWWFVALGIVSVAAVLGFAWRSRVAHLQRTQAAQEAFARQLMSSQEGERQRIAAELHDSLGQSLAIIKTRALMSLSTPADQDRALDQLREIAGAAGDAIAEVKEIAHNLRPYQLDRLGLTKTIEGMVKTISSTHDLPFALEVDRIDGLLAPDAEINLFRIIQESLNNIVKHANATQAAVRVKKNRRTIDVTIEDDGRGFDRHTTSPEQQRGGFGLIGMTERARLLGAVYRIRSVPGSGTTVTLSIAITDEK